MNTSEKICEASPGQDPLGGHPGAGEQDTAGLSSGRLQKTLRDHDVAGEMAMAAGQAAVCCFVLLLHLLAQASNGWQAYNPWVLSALAVLIATSALRYCLANLKNLPERLLDVLNVVDMSIFLSLIWSYQFAYDHPAGGVLKAPSFVLLFVLVALRALRFHPRPIIIAGATAAAGWCLIVYLALARDGTLAVTHDYSVYLTSYAILLGAEIERTAALAALTVFLALATYKARNILSQAAHAADYAEVLDVARANLTDARKARAKAEAATDTLHERERELTDQNRHFNAALDNMNQGLCMFDSEQRLIVCNALYASMYGLSWELVEPGTTFRQILEHRVAGKVFSGGVPEDYIEERCKAVAETEASKKIQTLTDGRLVAISHQPMAGGGWLATHEDVTDRKKTQDELAENKEDLQQRVMELREKNGLLDKQRNELAAHRDHLEVMVEARTAEVKRQARELELSLAKEKELNELQRQFVAMASHEFRTPLAIIDGTAQRLRRYVDDDRLTPAEAQKRIGTIRDAVSRMARLMESTLTAVRMENGKVAVEIGPCDVGTIVREVCEYQQELAKDHAISCDLAGIPETIQADAGALEQVFANLLSNAVKYAPGAPDIEVMARVTDDQVVISVSDHGLGIDEDDLPKMFERFFRARTSTGIAGTGIGLNLVKALVEMHGGSVDVESEKDKGSIFTVRLPVAGPERAKQVDDKAA